MKKKVFGRQLSRERASRRALFRSLTRALILYGKMETTKAKAKAVRPFIDKLLMIAKKDGVEARRRIYGLLGNDRKTADALVKLAGKFKKVGGFTRMVNLPARRGDAAELVRIEWAEDVVESDGTKGKGKQKSPESKKKSRENKKSESKNK